MQSDSGYTALHYACRSGHVGCVELLLRAGANVNVRTTVVEEESDFDVFSMQVVILLTTRPLCLPAYVASCRA